MNPLSQKLWALALQYGVEDIYAFGSRAKEVAARLSGQRARVAHPKSDVDIGIRTKPGLTLGPSERARLTLELEDLFKTSRVDLVILQEMETGAPVTRLWNIYSSIGKRGYEDPVRCSPKILPDDQRIVTTDYVRNMRF